MPQTTTQAPAPIVRRTPRQGTPQQIVANPDGSLPRSAHANEYRDSYPVAHPQASRPSTTRSIPTVNPLTSLNSQSTTAKPVSPKLPVLPKPIAPLQAPHPKLPATTNSPAASSLTSGAPKPAVSSTPKPASAPRPVSTPRTTAPAASAKAATAQPAALLPPGPFNRSVIVIDPSHGGTDVGSRVGDSVFEKDVDLQLAFKLRSLLQARGFTVVLTRESDTATLPDKPDSPLSLDVRAGLANRQQAVACLLLHATGTGDGAHLYTSELTPVPAEPYAAPWLTAQNGWVSQSLLLQKQIGKALTRASIPLVASRASVRPVDSLTCPALVIELAPENSNASSIQSDEYQQKVASAIATALIFWQNSAQPPARLAPPVYKAPPAAPKPETTPSVPAITSTPTPAVQP